MTERKHRSYTLWVKFKGKEWAPKFTVEEERRGYGPNPRNVILLWIAPYMAMPHWKQGKTWMILPKGQKPAAVQEKS